MKWKPQIIDAINNRLILRIQYESLRQPPLMIEPHAYGMRDGASSLFAWDRSVIDDDDWDHGWLWLDPHKVLLLGSTGGRFGGARRGYRHDMRQLDPMYAQI